MAQSNGLNGHVHTAQAQFDVPTIIRALETIHTASSRNDARRQASEYLDNVKKQPGTTQAGYVLANDISQPPLVRHFGLSLLEDVIKHQAFALNRPDSEELRKLVLSLSLTINDTSESFVRNKIAALWVELIKRSWALDWFDLDSTLCELWSGSFTNKEFVLEVLENLSEDVFVREDSTAVLRGTDLSTAMVEIFTCVADFPGGLRVGSAKHQMRHGTDGWTKRVVEFLGNVLHAASTPQYRSRLCVLALNTLRSVLSWIMTPAIISAKAMTVTCEALLLNDTDTVLAAVEALLCFYSRTKLEEIEVQALVHPLCHPNSVDMLKKVYIWSIVSSDDVIDPRYTASKKIAELLYHITSWLIQFVPPSDTDIQPYLQLLINVAHHDSLIVSIAAIHSWDKILESNKWRHSQAVQSCIQPILQVAMERLICYDMLPNAEDIPAVQFVHEDIELFPERQGFFLNYRRFCFSIIERISYTFLHDALSFMLGVVDSGLTEISRNEQSAGIIPYTRTSERFLRADALYSCVDAAFKGVHRWTTAHREEINGSGDTSKVDKLIQSTKDWSLQSIQQQNFQDPAITLRQIKNVVETSSKILWTDTEFAMAVLQHILLAFNMPSPSDSQLMDALIELHTFAIAELRQLCAQHATYFVTFYDQLQTKFNEIRQGSIDRKVQVDLQATLMLLVEHAKGVEPHLRKERLRTFLQPIVPAWQAQEHSLVDFETFLRTMAFDQAGSYFSRMQASKDSDWTVLPLDQDAQRIQTNMTDSALKLPLRETRVLLSVSTEGLKSATSIYDTICELWSPLLDTVIRNVLRLVSLCHKLHDVSAWPNMQTQQRSVIQRVLKDRYWQSGISGGSMHDFHNRVKSTKNTLEGFASSVRGRIRLFLENCYSILHTLGRLGSTFYSRPDIPQMISSALIETSAPLSPHHFGQLLSMLPKLVEECPISDRQHFLTPVLSSLLRQIDDKATKEWARVQARGTNDTNGTADDSLSNEMREESVLRQMTSRGVNMTTMWMDQLREIKLMNAKRIVNSEQAMHEYSLPSLREFILGSPAILEPLLTFCTHCLTFNDTKSFSTMVHSLMRFVPAFSTEAHLQGQEAAAVREYISTELLKAAISSLNDGYYADYQSPIACLVAQIWLSFGLPAHVPATETAPKFDRPAWTDTPRRIILSIPGIDPAKVDEAGKELTGIGLGGSQKRARAVILNLLEPVRGVRMSELGKIDNKQEKKGLLEKYKQRNANAGAGQMDGVSDGQIDRGNVELGGVADMFG